MCDDPLPDIKTRVVTDRHTDERTDKISQVIAVRVNNPCSKSWSGAGICSKWLGYTANVNRFWNHSSPQSTLRPAKLVLWNDNYQQSTTIDV